MFHVKYRREIGMANKRKHTAQYYKTWYDKYSKALSFYDIKTKDLKKPTAKSLARVKAQWKGIKKEKKKVGWVNLPTVHEASKFVENHPPIQETYQSIPNEGEHLLNYIEEIIDTINQIEPMVSRAHTSKQIDKEWKQYEEAKNHFIQQVEILQQRASTWLSDTEKYADNINSLLSQLQNSGTLQMIQQIAEYYAYEAIDELDGTLSNLMADLLSQVM